MSQQKEVYRTVVSSRGQTMTEYALILVTVAAVCLALIQNAGIIISTLVSHVGPLL
jgi:Flp pilus assembly pilin Flp